MKPCTGAIDDARKVVIILVISSAYNFHRGLANCEGSSDSMWHGTKSGFAARSCGSPRYDRIARASSRTLAWSRNA